MQKHFQKVGLVVAGFALTAASVSAGGLAFGAKASPAKTTGTIHVFVASTSKSFTSPGNDVITGVLTDYGHDHTVGKTNFQKIVLSKGSFEINATKLNKSFKGTVNKKACSVIETAYGAKMPISKGTGKYQGIEGVVTLRAAVALIGKTVNGKCDLNVEPAAQNFVIQGTGKVSY